MHSTGEAERRALLGLWMVPGLGPAALRTLRAHTGGNLAPLLTAPVAEWAQDLPAPVRRRLQPLGRLEDLAEAGLEQARRGGMSIAYQGDPAYPAELAPCSDAPPLLFHLGTPGAPRRRLAMVGSRHPDQGFLLKARRFARAVAEQGLCVVSGAAEGVDRACHFGALDAGGETWAFVGSALDELDAAQAKMLPAVLAGGGVYYSELPPGVRASKESFPRRNRLISGASHATLVLRAARRSGALYTAAAAVDQGRPVLALPGDPGNPAAEGCNWLIARGAAALCTSPDEACLAAGVRASPRPPRPGGPVDWSLVSPEARAAYQRLPAGPTSFDTLLEGADVPSSRLTAALCELELSGLVVQLPGKMYEKV
jgi:DNA processing protein